MQVAVNRIERHGTFAQSDESRHKSTLQKGCSLNKNRFHKIKNNTHPMMFDFVRICPWCGAIVGVFMRIHQIDDRVEPREEIVPTSLVAHVISPIAGVLFCPIISGRRSRGNNLKLLYSLVFNEIKIIFLDI